MPVEVLADLAAYRELVLAVARELFLKSHPGRARAPRGFENQFALVLKTVEEGSAAPLLEREWLELEDVPSRALPENDQFDLARDATQSMLANVEQLQMFADEYSPRVRSLIARLGRNLRSGESVEFCLPGAASGPKLTHDLFSKLAGAELALQDHFEINGYVEAVDFITRRIKVSTADGLVSAPLAPAIQQAAIASLNDHHQGRACVIKGVAQLDRHGALARFAEITSIEPIADVLETRILELRDLKSGWLDGGGAPLASSTHTWLEEVRRASLLGSFPLPPALFPTAEGGARAEWQIDAWSVSAEFEPASGTAYFHALNLQTDAEFDQHVAGVEALIKAMIKVEGSAEAD